MFTTAPPHPPGDDLPRTRRRGRGLAAVVATSVVAPLLAVLPTSPASAAASNALTFADGKTSQQFGANGAVIIDGVLAYDDGCVYDKGIQDFFYPATDVYIVPTGSTTPQGKLTDVGGENPNTIVALSSGVFLDETIGFTAPGGKLGAGEYDVVFDTCQDGFYTSGDTVFPRAVVVRLPETLPSVSPTIAAIKDRAREQYISWLQTHMILTALFSADKAKEIISCILVANPLCALAVLAHLLDEGHIGARQANQIQDLAAALAMNVAKNHGAIWKDPPDEDFDVLPVLERPEDGDLPRSGQRLFDAVADLTPALADEAALTDGLLHAIERYQGAQAAGDGDWALAQARAARDLSAALADQLDESTAVEQLRLAVADGGAALDARLAEGRSFANRVRTSGFTADEEHRLRDLGLSKSEIDGLEGQYVAQGQLIAYDRGDLTGALATLTSKRSAMADTLDESMAGWDAVVAQLEGSGTRTLPTADAGGPYTAPAGTSVRLDGSGSSAVAGASITGHAWDLDADGAFDDATGVTPAATFRAEGGQLVSLRVTDSAGRTAVTSTRVAVTRGDQPPTITTSAPQAATQVTVGSPVTLSVDASDPEGEPLTYRWERNGTALTAAGDSLTWTPTADDVGAHTVNLVVGDGTSRGTARTWRLTVSDVDRDGDGWTVTTDCDDTRAVVHPGLSERLGNGLDDDCSPSTADGPPGGLSGAVWSWGDVFALGDGTSTRRNTPAASPLLPEVVQLQAYLGRALAVLPDGTLRAWGTNHRGELGLGDVGTTRRPTPVLGVDSPTLTDVVQVETETMHTVALRRDGTVVAFGNNDLGQSGAGDDVAQHPRPVQVVQPDGTPLTGVVAVESGMGQQWAVLADGTLRSWGAQNCRGQWPYPEANTASPVPLFGKDVVQVSAGSVVLARKADGSVWACAGDHELLDRTKAPTSPEAATPEQMEHFGPGSGVIDVGAGGDAAVALKADGSVWMWGKNVNGELNVLGVVREEKVMAPRRVTLPEGAQVVDVEMDGSCTGTAVRADGSVLTWGCNTNGAAGTGSWTDPLPGFEVVQLGGGAAYATASVAHNGFALVRPQGAPPVERVTPWISIAARDASIGEAAGGAVELRLDAPARTAVEVAWAVEGGPAGRSTGTATVPAGASTVSVPVPVEDDTRDEHDEQLAFHVVGVSDGIRTARGVATVTVVDDDAAPTISVTPLEVDEGGTSLTDAEVEVRLSQASGKDVQVLWSTADATATSPADFSAASGHLLLPAGTTTAHVNVAVAGDDVPEPSESFSVVLRDPVDAVVGAGAGTVTVHDDDSVRLTLTSPTVTETDTGTVPATFTLTAHDLPADVEVTVPWTVAAGTADVPSDVTAGEGELVLSGTTPSGTVVAQVVADDVVEVRESFRLQLGAVRATGGRSVALTESTVATIVDDDVSQPEVPAPAFDGFYAPVVNLPLVNGMQAGRAVPLKFSLGGDHGLDVFATGHPASQRITCDSGAAVDAVEETSTAGASALTYDAATGRYHYVWKTERAWKGQCRRLVLRFVDGTEASAEFRFS